MSAFVLGVDTNVMVRFLADDDDIQTPLSARVLDNAANHPIFVSSLVMAETFTVLTKVKKFPAVKVIAAIRHLVSSSGFVVEAEELLLEALNDAERTGCGLPDALIALQNSKAGCHTTVTFDNRALRLTGTSPVKDYL